MAAVAAVVGLVAGVLLGFSTAGSGPRAEASGDTETSTRPTGTTLPDEFFTVILGSFDARAHADGALQQLRAQGADDAGILEREDYSSLRTRYAIYSGRFDSRDEAEAHELELAQRGITDAFWKHVTR